MTGENPRKREIMQNSSKKRERLKDFYLAIKDCKKCSLGATRTNFVFGSGNSCAQIIFIGEAPGKNEDLQGKPFVGQAGKLLDSLLGSIGFTRSEVFIANVLKCRPPQNRDPEVSEINICKGYLFEQIEIIDPAIICTMGRYSTQLILDTTNGINTLRGKIFKVGSRIIIPINHPAAALYTPSRLSLLKDDFARIKTVLDKLERDAEACDIEALSIENISSGKETSVAGASEALNNQAQPSIALSGNGEAAGGEPAGTLQKPGAPQDESRQLGLF